MSDNFESNPGAGGEKFAANRVTAYGAPALVPVSKIDIGGNGEFSPVNAANPLPSVDAAANAILAAIQTALGTLLTDAQLRATPIPVSTTAGYAEDTPHVTGATGNLMLAIRSDNDTPTANDGDYTILKLDEEGRLKVASKPASYPDITGDITAIQASIGVPVAGGTVAGDVSRSSNIMAFCTGTFNTVNCTFEGSLESSGDTKWFGIQAVRSNANTIETTTGNLSAAPAYAWELSVNALKRVRVRATARTSGTQSWRFVQGTYATEPIPAAQVTATQPVSGTVTVTGTVTSNIGTGSIAAGTNAIGDVGIQYRANATGAATTHKFAAAASVNNVLILTGARRLIGWSLTNTTASFKYFRFYNKATAPTSGESPTFMVGLPPNSTTTYNLPGGMSLPLGLGIACTGGVADTDATVTVANDVVGVIHYA